MKHQDVIRCHPDMVDRAREMFPDMAVVPVERMLPNQWELVTVTVNPTLEEWAESGFGPWFKSEL